MTRKTFNIQVNLHYTVEIDESSIPTEAEDKQEVAYNERQRRLLHAIVSSDARMQSYLKYLIASDAGTKDWRDWNMLILGEGDPALIDVLTPALTTLNKKDQQYFQKVEKKGILYENVETMEECFSVDLKDAEIVINESQEDED
jgi:hypothetical protein